MSNEAIRSYLNQVPELFPRKDERMNGSKPLETGSYG
jgi:hypothetical protein